MLLVAPDGTRAFDFWSGAGGGTAINDETFAIMDGSVRLSCSGIISSGTFGPTVCSTPPDSFTPGPPAPAPQVPGSFQYAATAGTSTFRSVFSGTAAHGAWSLFFWGGSGAGKTSAASGGWCLDITPGTETSTTTAVTPNPTLDVLGQSVTFTATVSGGVGSTGTVTFTDGGALLAGAPNGGVANVVSGVASISTSSLPGRRPHHLRHIPRPSNTFADSTGTTTMRVDKATGTPTISAGTWTYCNTGAVRIPAGTTTSTTVVPRSRTVEYICRQSARHHRHRHRHAGGAAASRRRQYSRIAAGWTQRLRRSHVRADPGLLLAGRQQYGFWAAKHHLRGSCLYTAVPFYRFHASHDQWPNQLRHDILYEQSILHAARCHSTRRATRHRDL